MMVVYWLKLLIIGLLYFSVKCCSRMTYNTVQSDLDNCLSSVICFWEYCWLFCFLETPLWTCLERILSLRWNNYNIIIMLVVMMIYLCAFYQLNMVISINQSTNSPIICCCVLVFCTIQSCMTVKSPPITACDANVLASLLPLFAFPAI